LRLPIRDIAVMSVGRDVIEANLDIRLMSAVLKKKNNLKIKSSYIK
jgi:hypothetical protein